MASTSASSVQKWFKYDVFLSFRGEDVRKTFVDHLYHALKHRGITTYKDDEKIEKGERINEQLIRAIKDSRFYIIVFSGNYASSSWCLDELVQIMECQKTTEQMAYPIFYDVEPTEVRYQCGAVGDAFAEVSEKKKRKRTSEDADLEKDVGRWSNALKEAANLAGWELPNTVDGHEAKFIEEIIEKISRKLHFINLNIDDNLVGMENRVKNAVYSLEVESDDVRMIGIKGIGGGGKTTLARAIFDHISFRFESKSFVENVREGSKGSGLKELQKQVLQDVLTDQSIHVTSVSDGKNKMKRMMPGRRALVVLDDVDHIEQLEALAGKPNWFKPGSRIIITTRDEQVLIAHKVNCIHDVNLLSNEEAICLFSRHAFGREDPLQGYEELSRKVVHYAAGLPLTIKVLGSHLCDRSELEWVDAINRLKDIPLKETLVKLELSYNGLEDDVKEIFLDVVCILKGQTKIKAIRILESCGFHAQIGLRVLEQKSLITFSEYGDYLGFHDHIEEMGRNIVRRLHPNEPSQHSRLWIEEEIEDILVNESGTKATRSIKLGHMDLTIIMKGAESTRSTERGYMDQTIIMKGLRKLKELRLLYVHGIQYIQCKVNEGSQHLPDALQCLCWSNYPFRFLPKTFQANKLVNLEMPFSNISELWERGERKVLKNLKFLDLSYSKLRTFDLSMTPRLEELNLERCRSLIELQMPADYPNLKSLNLSHSKVSHLNIGRTPNLEKLYLEECSRLKEFHAPVECLKNLVHFLLSNCLDVAYFKVDKQHESASLDSTDTVEITVHSVDVCPLHARNDLPWFEFTCTYDEPRSSWSGNLEKLFRFGRCACKNREYLLATICRLQHLRELTVHRCIPRNLGRLESLEKLSFFGQEFQRLPDSICMLKHLKTLKLEDCFALEQLPENICRLECLEELIIYYCRSLRDIPNSMCKMKCLNRLKLGDCDNIKKLPEELGSLECLKELWIIGTDINRLPQSIYQLKGLRIYGSREQLESYGFTSVISQVRDYTEYTYVEL